MDVIRHPEEFNCTRDRTISQRWSNYILKLERYFVMSKMTEPEAKQACLLYYGGDDLSNLFETLKTKLVLTDPTTNNDINVYVATITLLNEHFSSGDSVTYERSNFRATHQQEGESVTDYITRLRKKAKYCKFSEYNEEAAIIDQFIEHCTSNTLRVKLLATDDLKLDLLISTALSRELAFDRAKDICKNTGNDNAHTNVDELLTSDHALQLQTKQKPRYTNNNMYCYGCGSRSHVHGNNLCPAKNKECHNCHIKDHFQSMCHSPSKKNRSTKQPVSRKQINQISNNQYTEPPDQCAEQSSSKYEANYSHVKQVQSFTFYVNDVNTVQHSNHKLRSVTVDNCGISFIIDSGATTSIMDSSTYYKFFRDDVKLEPSPVSIYTYGSKVPIPILGVFYPTFTYRSNKTVGPLIVTKFDNAGCLLSETVSTQLGIIKMDHFVNIIADENIENIVNQFPELCNSIGKLKNYQMKLDIDPDVLPIIQTCRTIPYHQLKLVDKEINKLLAEDILEPVSSPTSWCSPLQVVTQSSGETRLCVDLRQANKAVKRTLFPIPTLEDIVDKLSENNAKYFSKIDLKKGYHQIELEEGSRDITTFRYPGGIYRYKRLVFGLSSAFELFQQQISKLFQGESGIANISDDILVFGQSVESHNQNLIKCLSILRDNGLTINRDKCEFLVTELAYYGFIISEKGIKPTESKVESIKSAKRPTNAKEVRSFLGLVNYLGRFIPNLATLTESLRKLTTKDYVWQWTAREEECFNNLKNIVSSDTVMCHFRTGLPIKIVVDLQVQLVLEQFYFRIKVKENSNQFAMHHAHSQK